MSVVLYHTDCYEGTGSCLGFVSSTRDGTVLGSEVDSCFSEFRAGQPQVYFVVLSLLLVFLAESCPFPNVVCEGVQGRVSVYLSSL